MKTLRVNDINVDFVLDTGAEVSTLTESTSDKLNMPLENPSKCLIGTGGKSPQVKGTTMVNIKSKAKSIESRIYILKDFKKKLLGLLDLNKLNLLAVVNRLVANAFDPVTAFKSNSFEKRCGT